MPASSLPTPSIPPNTRFWYKRSVLPTAKNQIHRIPTSLIWKIAADGVPVFADSDHDSAHNKVIVIDAGSPDPTLITGSFNFTHAAQYKNAENVLLIKGNAALTDLYRKNWQHHYEHSLPYQQQQR